MLVDTFTIDAVQRNDSGSCCTFTQSLLSRHLTNSCNRPWQLFDMVHVPLRLYDFHRFVQMLQYFTSTSRLSKACRPVQLGGCLNGATNQLR